MVRLLVLSVAILTLTGCSAFGGGKVRVEYRDVIKPVLSCPSPPVIARPFLPIDDLTIEDKQNPDKVVKAYKASIKLLQGYGIQMEQTLDQYKSISKNNEDLKKRVGQLFPEDQK